MKNHSPKKLLAYVGIALGAVLLSSCTANFCSDTDKASMSYPYEQGVTVYVDKTTYDTLVADGTITTEDIAKGYAGQAIDNNDLVYKYIPRTETGGYAAKKAQGTFASILSSATSNGYAQPTVKYWSEIDNYVLEAALVNFYVGVHGGTSYIGPSSYTTLLADAEFKTFLSGIEASPATACVEGVYYVNPYHEFDTNGTDATETSYEVSILRQCGKVKMSGVDSELWGFHGVWTNELMNSTDPDLGLDGCPTADFLNLYKSTINSKVSSITSCIATRDGYFGHYGDAADWRVAVEQKSWGYAWSKGFLEGLLVYPISWLVDTIAYGLDASLGGVGQIWALIIVTLIVRGLLLAATFKNTMDQQKMQALQPQLAKIQAKYPNSNTNQAEKQRLSQEQMALYKRNKINPLGQILTLVIQFPVFICVWSGLSGSSALATGEVLNMRLSDTIRSILLNFNGTWYQNTTGWWTALVLFLLMAAVQIMAMLLPRFFAKAQEKKLAKMGRNPAQTQQNNTMKWMMIFMMGFTIVMGFMLPSAMGIYWLIGGLISMIQTLITQIVLAKKKKLQ